MEQVIYIHRQHSYSIIIINHLSGADLIISLLHCPQFHVYPVLLCTVLLLSHILACIGCLPMWQEHWTYLFAVTQANTGPYPSGHQRNLQSIRGIGFGTGGQQQTCGTRCFEAQEQLLRLGLGALTATQPHRHMLAAIEGQCGRFPTAGGSMVEGGGAVAYWPIPALKAGAAVQTRISGANICLHVARRFHRSYRINTIKTAFARVIQLPTQLSKDTFTFICTNTSSFPPN